MENTTNKYKWVTPVAIIIGGALIAAAIFFRAPAGSQGADILSAKETDLASLASDQGIKKKSFTACMEGVDAVARVAEDSDEIMLATNQTAGTPFLVIEFGEVSGTKSEHLVVPGAVPQALIEQVIKDKKLPKGFPVTKIGNYRGVTADDHILGSITAPVRIIEYSDLDCPFCKQIHPELHAVVDNNPNVAWVYRHHPLDSLHPQAREKAEASECVAELKGNDAFWGFIDSLLVS